MSDILRHRKQVIWAGVLVSILWALNAAPVIAQSGHATNLASLPAAGETTSPSLRTSPPKVLAPDQADLYQRIFALQDDGNMQAADKLISQLEDEMLLGQILAQRYLHPTGYISKWKELQVWLSRWHDLPEASKIYKLALHKGGKKLAAKLRKPTNGYLSGAGEYGGGVPLSRSSYRHLSNADRKKAIQLWNKFRHRLSNGWTLSVKRIVTSDDAARLITSRDHNRMRAALAHAYFVDGRDDWALMWAEKAMKGKAPAPMAHWPAGLALWRMGKYEEARHHFEALASFPADKISGWMVSAGSWWAARANLRTRNPQQVNHWLKKAAEYQRTFYGVIARHALGLPIRPRWEKIGLSRRDIALLQHDTNAQHALALHQIGQLEAAEKALRKSAGRALANGDYTTAEAILALAEVSHMPALAMRLGSELGDPTGPIRYGARFPLPDWTPKEGWTVDKALVFAFIRQESGFNPEARSPAGARGLMQLMPSTAAYIAKDPSLRKRSGRERLTDPGENLKLGQDYLQYLMNLKQVGNNLFFMAAAYNAGPGRLSRWLKTGRHMDDPLLFIECISSRETRIFIERVLSNLWIYRERMGQPTPSLDAVVEGHWPLYAAMDELAPVIGKASSPLLSVLPE